MSEGLSWTEGQILGVSGAYWQTCALHAAVKLGVFTALGEARQTGEPLARTLNANPRALTMLLDALCAMGLVEKAGDGYTNTEAARVWLSKDSPRYLGYMIMHYHHLVTAWSQLDKAVMTGGPVERGPIPEAEERESFSNTAAALSSTSFSLRVPADRGQRSRSAERFGRRRAAGAGRQPVAAGAGPRPGAHRRRAVGAAGRLVIRSAGLLHADGAPAASRWVR